MKPDRYWRRLVDAYRRRRLRRAGVTAEIKAQLADELLWTLSPGVLAATGHLRRRSVYRRRFVAVRERPR